MRILAIETTERLGGVALADGHNILFQIELDPSQRSAESLAPGIARGLERAGWRPNDVDLVAVTIGPGSFTGLRLGVTTAKTFAYAVGAEVLGVDTLETIAAATPTDVAAVAVAIDAQRGEVVAAQFARDPGGRMVALGPATLVTVETWLENAGAGVPVAGPILAKIADRLPSGVVALAPEYWHPTAAGVAALAAIHHAEGRRDDLWTLVPRYSRRSAAEEKADRKRQGEEV